MSQFRTKYTDLPAGRLLSDALYVGGIARNIADNERNAQQTHGLTSRLATNSELRSWLGLGPRDSAQIAKYASPHQVFGKLAVLSDAQLVDNGLAMGLAVALCPRILPVMSALIEETAGMLKIQKRASEAFLEQYEHGPLQREASWRQMFLICGEPDLNYKPNGFLHSAKEIATMLGHDLQTEMMPKTGDFVRKLLNPGLR